MIYRAKAPLRLGLAGGGTDVSPYSDTFGGCVLNATINMYAYCSLEVRDDERVSFQAIDMGMRFEDQARSEFELDNNLKLHKAIYNRLVRDFNHGKPLSVTVSTWTDAPIGSGLGTSSTLVVAILSAYREYLKLPLGEYDLAHLAFEIERRDCSLSGGKQDQYAATFGGFNFIEFYEGDKVIVNPLRIRTSIINELQSRTLLYYTGQSRESARIIDDQIKTVTQPAGKSIEAMHSLKKSAIKMKELLLRNDIDSMVDVVKESWVAKKATSSAMTNSELDALIFAAEEAGVEALKLSGAGGGGFMLMFIKPNQSLEIRKALAKFPGEFYRFEFNNNGEMAWKV